MVEEIEDLGPELQHDALARREVCILHERAVQVLQAGASERIPSHVPQKSRGRNQETAGIVKERLRT